MTRFCLVVHSHQPVGNFPWVFEEAYRASYLPFLQVLKRHPAIHLTLHYSGSLLDWLKKEHPEFLADLKGLVLRGQAELLGGGYYEPILSLLPEKDALGQLQLMNQQLSEWGLASKEGTRGAWLAERVWEPSLPSLLSQAGIRYTVVDDHHLERAGIPEGGRFGHYLTEDKGKSVAVFASLKQFRYLVPFKPVEEVMDTLRRVLPEGAPTVVLADDGEKFGLWPGTHKWVYEEGWLESFFQQLEGSSGWLRLDPLGRCLHDSPPLGRVYLPCSSYEEMGEWSGGFFRNFFVKYPEADTLYHKMLWTSSRLDRASLTVDRESTKTRRSTKHNSRITKKLLEEARQHLYMAQANDAYWHGVFGGLYLRHLRRGVWQHLLQAEQALDGIKKRGSWCEWEGMDRSADGKEKLLLRSKDLTLLLDPGQGGQVLELSDKMKGLNLLDTLARRRESYHEKFRLKASGSISKSEGAQGPVSIHESQTAVAGLDDLLVYDTHRRAGWMDHVFPLATQAQDLAFGREEELGDFLKGPYRAQVKKGASGLRVILARQGHIRTEGVSYHLGLTKTFTLIPSGRRVVFTYQLINRSTGQLSFLFGSEININLKDAHVNRIGEAEGVSRFSLVDPAAQLQVSWEFNKPARLFYFPLETVSDSEHGMERTYQGVSLVFGWELHLDPGESWKIEGKLALEEAS